MMERRKSLMRNPYLETPGRSPGPQRHNQAGVTLLELMIVVTVVGILGLIAIPNYRQYTMRTHRTEAKAALLKLAANQERFYLQNRTYSAAVDNTVGFPSAASENGTYALTIATNAGWTLDYTATATPVAGGGPGGIDQSGDGDCTSFSITSTGQRTATGAKAQKCW